MQRPREMESLVTALKSFVPSRRQQVSVAKRVGSGLRLAWVWNPDRHLLSRGTWVSSLASQSLVLPTVTAE